MADPFDLETERQRRVVLGALAVYLVLFVVQLATNNPVIAASADLLLAALVIAGSLLGLSRLTGRGDTDPIPLATVVAFLVAGVAIAYDGLAKLGTVPKSPTVQGISTLALLAGLLLYFFGTR